MAQGRVKDVERALEGWRSLLEEGLDGQSIVETSAGAGIPLYVFDRINRGEEVPCEDMARRIARALGCDPNRWAGKVRRIEHRKTLSWWHEKLSGLPDLGDHNQAAKEAGVTAPAFTSMVDGDSPISDDVLRVVCRRASLDFDEWVPLVPLPEVWKS